MNKTLYELAELIGGTVLGEDRVISGIAGIEREGLCAGVGGNRNHGSAFREHRYGCGV